MANHGALNFIVIDGSTMQEPGGVGIALTRFKRPAGCGAGHSDKRIEGVVHALPLPAGTGRASTPQSETTCA